MSLTRLSLSFALMLTVAASGALAQETGAGGLTLEGGRLVGADGQPVPGLDLPGEVLAVHRSADLYYLALGEHGAAVVRELDGAFEVVKRFPISHGRVTGFMAGGDSLWMTVDAKTAVLLEGGLDSAASESPTILLDGDLPEKGGAPAAPEAKQAPQPVSSSTPRLDREIRVLARYPGAVKLDVGSADGVKAGDLLTAFRHVAAQRDEGERSFEGKEISAVLEIKSVSETESIARLCRGDRIMDGDEITLPAKGEKPRTSKVYPRHLEHAGEVTVTFRPLLSVGSDSGFGTLSDLAISYWGAGWFAGLTLQPMGIGGSDGEKVVTAAMTAEGGFDSRAFGIGLGVGFSATNGDMDSLLGSSVAYADVESSDGAGTETDNPKWDDRSKAAFTLAQVIRLGARDGLNFAVRNTLVFQENKDVYDGDEDPGFVWGEATMRFTIPLAMRTDLFLEGGGGFIGFWYGAIGVHSWVLGNGEPGSVGLSASVGGAGIWAQQVSANKDNLRDIYIGGPMIGLGLTYRFGR